MIEGIVETVAVMLPFNDNAFELTVFAEDRLMLLMSQSHPLAMRNQVHFKDLISEPFIFFSEDFRINDLVRSACGIYSSEPIVAGRSNHLDLIITMVKAGVGVTLLPNSMCNKNPIDNLAIIPVIEPELSYKLALANNKNNYQSRSCKAWTQLAIEKLMNP